MIKAWKMFGMGIDKVKVNRNEVEITTTGAVYLIKKTNPAEILCYQRIGGKKLRTTLTIEDSLEGLKLDSQDKESIILYQPVGDFGFSIRIYADSLMSIRAGKATKVTYRGNWLPEYSSIYEGNFLLIDKNGGIAAYPLGGRNYHPGYSSDSDIKFTKKSWEISLFINGAQTFLTSVFPPRPFNIEQSLEDRIVHHLCSHVSDSGCWIFHPDDEEIKEYSKNGNILVLHYWKKGFKEGGIRNREELIKKDAAWAVFQYISIDKKELKRVIKKAHKLGMRIIPYMSPIFFPGEPDEFIKEMSRVIEKYEFDGVYFDGVANDIWRAYTIMKGVRKTLGNKILYVHIPSPIIGKCYPQHYAYCPFIDTYADYILRMEHRSNLYQRKDDIRYLLGGYNVSNSIAFICNYDYSPENARILIQQAVKDNFRIPYWVGQNICLKERQKTLGQTFHPLSTTNKILEKEYFPVLNRLMKDRRKKNLKRK